MTIECNEIDYAYTQKLNASQWAWEFLRRNKDYQKDYQWFISLWQALEKDYGKPPNMDHQAWKQDPRSYKVIDLFSEQDGNCAIADDKLLIECWMGYKWGFFKFPQSPKLNAFELDLELAWRPLAIDYKAPEKLFKGAEKPIILATDFDLTRPLKEQFEHIKRQALIKQRQLKKQGLLEKFTVSGQKNTWQSYLMFLDHSQQTGDSSAELAGGAHYYVQNYLSILTLLDK